MATSHWQRHCKGSQDHYCSLWAGLAKNKNQNFEETIFQKKKFAHGEKENLGDYSLILEYAELSFPILNNYSTKKRQPCPRATVFTLELLHQRLST